MLNAQRIAAVEYELSIIDRDIETLFNAGYGVDVDALLDQRLEQQDKRERLKRGEIPNG